jgi:hypothetical protein
MISRIIHPTPDRIVRPNGTYKSHIKRAPFTAKSDSQRFTVHLQTRKSIGIPVIMLMIGAMDRNPDSLGKCGIEYSFQSTPRISIAANPVIEEALERRVEVHAADQHRGEPEKLAANAN